MNLKLRFAMLAVMWIGIVILLVSGVAFAQLPTASITGTVQDSSQAAIPGATVTATSTETALTRTAQTGPDGHYVLLSLPIGNYDVKAEAASFSPVLQRGLTLTVSQEAIINFTLTVGSVSQEVSVTAEAPLVETTNGSLGGLVNEERTADLPLNGRNFTDLTLMQTGISANYHGTSTATVALGLDYTSNGAGVQSNYITLDGASMKQGNGYNGGSIIGTQLGIEGIREYLVVTNSFKAEYGMVVGSQTIVATKSGTNQFHGSAFDFLRNSALDARQWTDPPQIPLFHRENFGGSFGGPIKKNKTFFFLTYEGIRQTDGLSNALFSPTAGAATPVGGFVSIPVGGGSTTVNQVAVANSVIPFLALYPPATSCLSTKPLDVFPYCAGGVGQYTDSFPTPTREDYGQVRIDETLSDKDSFFGRYTADDALQTNNNTRFLGFPETLAGRSQYVTIAENHVFSQSLLNTARLSYSRPVMNFNSPSSSSPLLSFEPSLNLQMGSIAPGSGLSSIGPNTIDPFAMNLNLFTFSDDLSWTHGAHTFKFGTLINRSELFAINNSSTRGAWTFSNFPSFLAAVPNQLSLATPGSITDRTMRWYTFGFYAQDDWRVTPRLTLNLGLRYEINTTINEVSGLGWSDRNPATDSVPGDATASTHFTLAPPVYSNPSLHNFGPRVGFAWDIFGDSKTALRGGFAYLYDITTEMAGATTVATDQPPLSGVNVLLSTGSIPLIFPVQTVFPTIPATTTLIPNTIRSVDWNLHQPHMLEWNLTAERSLPGSMSLSVSYTGTRGINLLQIIDANHTAPTIINGQPYWSGVIPSPSSACTPGSTPNPRVNCHFQSIEYRTAGGESWYNSLQVSFQKRLSHGLQFQTSYTWAHCEDLPQGQVGGESAGSSSQPLDYLIPGYDKGNCDFDIKNSLIFNTLYNLPDPVASGFGHTLLGGWRLGSILTLKSGQPFTVADSGNASRSLNGSYSGLVADRPNLTLSAAGCNGSVYTGNPNQWYNPACFTPQALYTISGGTATPGCTGGAGVCYGTIGNEGRNQFYGPNFRNLDFSITKDTPLHWLGEAGSVQFRTEFFNITNHPELALPTLGAYTYTNATTAVNAATLTPIGTAGKITQTEAKSRQIQFALKIIF